MVAYGGGDITIPLEEGSLVIESRRTWGCGAGSTAGL
jgi:hypothetical protein